jgi:hypothetical protein
MYLGIELYTADIFFELKVTKLSLRVQGYMILKPLRSTRLHCLLPLQSPKANKGIQVIYFYNIGLKIPIIYVVVEFM